MAGDGAGAGGGVGRDLGGIKAAVAAGTVADRLRRARRRRFVGRAAELELLRGALAADEAPFSVLFIFGPGGVGKTALLGVMAEVAAEAGARPVRLDARMMELSPQGFMTALGAARGLAPGAPASEVLTAQGRHVVLLDTYEAAAPLDDWFRARLVPELPGDWLVVIAGRDPPSPGWMEDPGWRELLRVVALRNLMPDDTRAYLRDAGVPAAAHEWVLRVTHGHSLALALLVDVMRQQPATAGAAAAGAPEGLQAAPDVVRALMERFVTEVPSPRHRRALEVCAHARFTDEELLRAALGGADAGEVFAWLRRLSFVEEGPRGVFPHDLARDVLEADLRWRDASAYVALHRQVRAALVARIRGSSGEARQQAVSDLLFLHRGHPVGGAAWDWATLGQVYADMLRPTDREAILTMAKRHEGQASAALVAYWLDR